MEYIVPSLKIAVFIDLADEEIVEERLLHLLELEEDRFVAGFHQQVQKNREKAWHNRHVKSKTIKEGDLVLIYDSKYAQFPGKFRMHWLGPYQVKHVTEGRATSLAKLDGTMVPIMVNGSRLKHYRDSQPPFSTQKQGNKVCRCPVQLKETSYTEEVYTMQTWEVSVEYPVNQRSS